MPRRFRRPRRPTRLRRARIAVLAGVVAALALVAIEVGLAPAAPGCAPTFSVISSQASRAGSGVDVRLEVLHTNTCHAEMTVTADNGTFARLTLPSVAGMTGHAFRLDAKDLCQVKRIPSGLRLLSHTKRSGTCEQAVLAVYVGLPNGPVGTAVRNPATCVVVPFARLRSDPTLRAKRTTIPVDIRVVQVQNPPGTPGGPFLEDDSVNVHVSDKDAVFPGVDEATKHAELHLCDAR